MKSNINKEEYAAFIDNLDWNWFSTLTTEYKLTQNSARRLITNFSANTHNTVVFYVFENFKNKGGCHIHAALNVPEGIQEKELRRQWDRVSGGKKFIDGKYVSSNKATFKKRNISLRAGAYFTKEIMDNSSIDNYDFFV